jgi:hypothetical protein
MERSILVCGGRDGQPPGTVFKALDAYDLRHSITHLVTGSLRTTRAQGRLYISTDAEAFAWALERELPASVVPAQWSLYGRSAGPRRNRRMLELFPIRGVLAFPGGRGTYDMVEASILMGIPVRKFNMTEDRMWWSRYRGGHS